MTSIHGIGGFRKTGGECLDALPALKGPYRRGGMRKADHHARMTNALVAVGFLAGLVYLFRDIPARIADGDRLMIATVVIAAVGLGVEARRRWRLYEIEFTDAQVHFKNRRGSITKSVFRSALISAVVEAASGDAPAKLVLRSQTGTDSIDLETFPDLFDDITAEIDERRQEIRWNFINRTNA